MMLAHSFVALLAISATQPGASAQAQPDAAMLAQAVDRCMTTYAVRLTRTEATDEAIFTEATQGCGPLSGQLNAAIAREYGADQSRELLATIAASARPNFMQLLQRIRADRQNRANN